MLQQGIMKYKLEFVEKQIFYKKYYKKYQSKRIEFIPKKKL